MRRGLEALVLMDHYRNTKGLVKSVAAAEGKGRKKVNDIHFLERLVDPRKWKYSYFFLINTVGVLVVSAVVVYGWRDLYLRYASE